MSPTSIVTEFINAWNQNDIGKAMGMLSEDVFYHNIPMEPIRGRAGVQAFVNNSKLKLGTRTRPHWQLLAIAENGDTVLTERIDAFHAMDGHRKSFDVPLMGVFRVADGKITEWKDYFDLETFRRGVAEYCGED
ncbi:limonene-1,2-epoxide hydrolase family protein [Bradyrhizobium betae]|uniref:Limonene-1,2-epoxide hydrolase domain-containing protein n=1 Tax=Bradyrhizobium betae TaxID=244734 RepID=A0A4Q1VNH8_9BRAD|nr:limonene-1,2-epoxide hydrolase family protein [Bradyrhizobium betae]RXT54255.1 hypothetical protein B5V03_02105 [Bradyrhizobium betae]